MMSTASTLPAPASTGPTAPTGPIVDKGAALGVEVSAADFGARGVGGIVWMTPLAGGDVSLADLKAALVTAHSGALPPEAPSAIVRTARAAETVAKAHGYSCVARRKVADAKRGTDGWELVSGSRVDPNGQGALGARVSPIVATARAGTFAGEAPIVGELQAAYATAADVLTSEDLSSWFVTKVSALSGLPIKAGVYYLPPESAVALARLVRAIRLATNGRYEVCGVALASTQATIRSVISALTADTEAACTEIDTAIAEGAGRKALEAREQRCAKLLARAASYESLLGVKLDAIRAAVTQAESSTAAAMLALSADDAG